MVIREDGKDYIVKTSS